MTEDEMVGWHHQLNGHEFEQTPGDGEGQGSLVCCSPWGHKELDMTECLNKMSLQKFSLIYGNCDRLFSWTPKSLQMVTIAMKLKDTCF